MLLSLKDCSAAKGSQKKKRRSVRDADEVRSRIKRRSVCVWVASEAKLLKRSLNFYNYVYSCVFVSLPVCGVCVCACVHILNCYFIRTNRRSPRGRRSSLTQCAYLFVCCFVYCLKLSASLFCTSMNYSAPDLLKLMIFNFVCFHPYAYIFIYPLLRPITRRNGVSERVGGVSAGMFSAGLPDAQVASSC